MGQTSFILLKKLPRYQFFPYWLTSLFLATSSKNILNLSKTFCFNFFTLAERRLTCPKLSHDDGGDDDNDDRDDDDKDDYDDKEDDDDNDDDDNEDDDDDDDEDDESGAPVSSRQRSAR